MMFLMSLLLLSGWIAVVSSITLMGVDFMDPVISHNAWFCTLSNVDADDSVVDPYSRCGRIVPIYTFLNTVSAAPHWAAASFLSKANLRLSFASALLMCVFQVCLLSKVIPRYVALSVCSSSVSSNIIFIGFGLVDKVKSVLRDLVVFIFTHQSCAQLDKMLVASWSRTLAVVAYSSVLHRTKSSAYIAHFTGDGNFLVSSLINTKISVGDMIPPCGTPCLRSIFLLFVLSITTLARRLCRYDLIHRNIFPAMLHFFSFRSRPSL